MWLSSSFGAIAHNTDMTLPVFVQDSKLGEDQDIWIEFFPAKLYFLFPEYFDCQLEFWARAVDSYLVFLVFKHNNLITVYTF